MKNKKLYFTCALLMILLGTSDALRGIFSPLFLKEFGLSMSQISIIVSASYLGNLVCLLFGGVILDKVGSKKAMVGFIILLICSELLLLLGAKYAFLLLGFSYITLLSTSSIPIPKAGRESVIRLIHNKCIADKGVPKLRKPKAVSKDAINIVNTSPILEDNKYLTHLRILS